MTPQNNTHAGPVSGWTWSSGLPHVRAFGLDGEVQRIESAVTQTFGYDAAGRMVSLHLWSQTTPLQYDTQSAYTLDPLSRLTGAQTQIALAQGSIGDNLLYAYDANGNRQGLAWNSIPTQYGYSGNRLTSSSGAASKSYTYDSAGRMIGDGLYTYTYNGLGRLATVSGGSGILAGYRYNAFGQRVAKDSAGGNVRFVYDEAGHLLGEYTDSGALIQELVWLEDLPVATLRPKTGGGMAVYYIHPDHLGTPRQITDSTNQIVWRWDSPDPFGYALPDENPGSGGVFEFNLRFPGQYYDRETGRFYNWWRDYDPGTGRYTTSDPIGLAGGLNRYTYVGGNPISDVDSLGLEGWNFDGWGDTEVCSYYDKRHKETQCDYYKTAADICRGLRPDVNSLTYLGISQAWASGRSNSSQSEIANKIRKSLIEYDRVLRSLSHENCGCPRGDMIDWYHNQSFSGAGVSPFYYGGNLWPLWPNPVPKKR